MSDPLAPMLSYEEVYGDGTQAVEEPADETPTSRVERRELRLVRASDIEPASARWAWAGRIPLAGVTLLAGREGHGKTAFVMYLLARLTRGQLEGDFKGRPMHVVYIGVEDDPNVVIAPRLIAAGADMERVHLVQMSDWFEVLRDLDALEEKLRHDGIEVAAIVVDPLDAHLGAGVDTHRKAEVQAAIGPLAELSQRHDCAVIGIAHLNKGDAKNLLGRVVGSVAFTTASRSVLAVGEHPNDPTVRVCVLAKTNMGQLDLPSPCFRIERTTIEGGHVTARVVVLGEEMIDPDSIVSVPDAEERSKVDDAADWLRELLADGPMLADEVKRLATVEGISAGTLKRAKLRAAVVHERLHEKGSRSVWKLS